MEIKFKELPLETQMWIAPEFRKYFDQVTRDNAEEWLMNYSYGVDSLWSSFEQQLSTNDIGFDEYKLAIFQDGQYLYKIKNGKDITYIAHSKGDGYRYLNYQLNTNIMLDTDEVCIKIEQAMNDVWELKLEKEDFLMTSRYVHILSDIEPFIYLNNYSNKFASVRKAIVHIKHDKIGNLNEIEILKTVVRSKFNEDTPLIIGVSVVDQDIKSGIDVFIYTDEEYIVNKEGE